LPQDTFINRLVSVAMNAIILAEFERHLDQLSSNDVPRVLGCLRSAPTWEAGVFESIQGEARHFDRLFQTMDGPPNDIGNLGLEGAEGLFKNIKPGDWRAFLSSAKDRTKSRLTAAEEVLKGPEKTWFSELKDRGWTESQDAPISPKSLADAGEQLADIFTDLIPQIGQTEAKYRTQLRLLRLHMRILDHKWRNGRLPDKLEMAAPPEELQDVFGGGEFQYRPDQFGHYELFSKGFRGTGRLDLKYRKDPNAPKQDDGEPPPPQT
jgi:hypothetical protein